MALHADNAILVLLQFVSKRTLEVVAQLADDDMEFSDDLILPFLIRPKDLILPFLIGIVRPPDCPHEERDVFLRRRGRIVLLRHGRAS